VWFIACDSVWVSCFKMLLVLMSSNVFVILTTLFAQNNIVHDKV